MESRDKVKAFLEEYEALCRKYGLLVEAAQPFEAVEVAEATEEKIRSMIEYLAERAGLKESPQVSKDSIKKWLKNKGG